MFSESINLHQLIPYPLLLILVSVFGFQGTFLFDCLPVIITHKLLHAIITGKSILTSFIKMSGDGEIRTLDPLLARQVLSQLSYTPIGKWA